MSQYDAAAMPMYASLGVTTNLTPFTVIQPEVDLMAKNTPKSYGALQSSKMDFKELDEAPMAELNEILWKNVKGSNSPMPSPIHRLRPLIGPQ